MRELYRRFTTMNKKKDISGFFPPPPFTNTFNESLEKIFLSPSE